METLFEMKQPKMVLHIQDTATSEDTLYAHLQRKGWKLSRVHVLQESIASKLTIDIFDLTTRPLSAPEIELQNDIQDYLNGVTT